MTKIYTVLIFMFVYVISFANNIDNIKIETMSNKNDILRYVDIKRTPQEKFLATIEVIDFNGKKENKFSLNVGVYPSLQKTFAIYSAPSNMKGQTILNTNDSIYISVPNTSNPIKISPQQKLIGQASVADIASFSYHNNYNVVSVNKQNNQYILELQAKDNSVSYSKVTLSITGDFYPLNAKLYTLSGKLLKTVIYDNLVDFEHNKYKDTIIITDAINEELKTTLIFKSIELKNIPNSSFDLSNIKRLQVLY